MSPQVRRAEAGEELVVAGVPVRAFGATEPDTSHSNLQV